LDYHHLQGRGLIIDMIAINYSWLPGIPRHPHYGLVHNPHVPMKPGRNLVADLSLFQDLSTKVNWSIFDGQTRQP